MFEGTNPEKVWLLLRTIFDIFAMHDVSLLLTKIVKWLNKSLSYFPSVRNEEAYYSGSPEELYQEFRTGVDLACILSLYGGQSDSTTQLSGGNPQDFEPDFRMIY